MMCTSHRPTEGADSAPLAVIDPSAPCGWCGSTSRARVQRGPSLLGYQCADADACNADHLAELSARQGEASR